ncbi:MAG: hypothetical protein ACI9PY_002344 [Ascidiaceihabitans sp.]|jgi:hypothetical protein
MDIQNEGPGVTQRICSAGLICWFALCFGVQTAVAENDTQIFARLGMIEHQAMLAHRMTKSACLVMMGADAKEHAEVALLTAQQFETQMQVLINGDAAHGIGKENDVELRAALENAQAFSNGLTASSAQIASGDFHSVPVGLMISRNGAVANRMEDIRQGTLARYSSELRQNDLVNTVHWANAQNALIQELLRDLCFITLDISDAGAKGALLEKLAVFEERSVLLKIGSAPDDIAKAPSIHIKIELGKVITRWGKIKPYLEAAAAGETADLSDIQLAYVYGEAITANMKKILDRYAKLSPAG